MTHFDVNKTSIFRLIATEFVEQLFALQTHVYL